MFMWHISVSNEGGDGANEAQGKASVAVKKKQQEAALMEGRAQEKDTSPIAAIGSLLGKLFVSGASACHACLCKVASHV
jgi:hypothetical protein